ncbi:MAG: hypothetical protein LUH22_10760 [Bacteroides sp.]|nr:hypothetical protein [Bacteroides sp.]
MDNNKEVKECIVIMPIEDRCFGYKWGHFRHVYDCLIKPSVNQAGFIPVRADELCSREVQYDMVINKIVMAPIAVFDLSTLNERIITGLKIRKAFNKPVIIISDKEEDSLKDFLSKNVRYINYRKNIDTIANFYVRQLISNFIRSFSQSARFAEC